MVVAESHPQLWVRQVTSQGHKRYIQEQFLNIRLSLKLHVSLQAISFTSMLGP